MSAARANDRPPLREHAPVDVAKNAGISSKPDYVSSPDATRAVIVVGRQASEFSR
jgi:hypothetical protein